MLKDEPDHEAIQKIVSRMLDRTEEDRGTVQVSAADAAVELVDDGMSNIIILAFTHLF